MAALCRARDRLRCTCCEEKRFNTMNVRSSHKTPTATTRLMNLTTREAKPRSLFPAFESPPQAQICQNRQSQRQSRRRKPTWLRRVDTGSQISPTSYLDHVTKAAHRLGYDVDLVRCQIVAYADRYNFCHGGIKAMIHHGDLQILAERIMEDKRSLIRYRKNP